ncbi:MAG TPA: AzlC family ABC transporter permease [Methylomusa anaerophila]|uniref:Inner membrane protein YgaZ n=1 Tax=Methylomusa anaerophila TaxID=1930071 RepID=A0A348AG37_9FIRM|nr:AzlC family ABC transporter permease [Methylomusa anaerophila]BBB90035.1 inner membrane protein YgaZ [Methylomusa anaerophila]HML88237.1 AzlC family ABC transporter permease [Methylomusa anaerophila]
MESCKASAAADNLLATTDFWLGARDSIPIIIGVVPFGITCGVMGLAAGLTPVETVLMSLLVFAGAAQFISISMIAAGVTGWWLIVCTTLLVNLRHLLMGASLAPHLMRLPALKQMLLTFGMADETYAITINRITQNGYSASFQLGSNTAAYLTWAGSTIAGVLMGGYIPDPLAWGLDFAMPATFLAMLIPRLADRNSFVVCGVASLTAVLGALYLPGKWYIIVACFAASITGGLIDRRQEEIN